MTTNFQNKNIDHQQILKEEIQKTREELPFSLTVSDLVDLTGVSQNKVYDLLAKGKIPGANKLMGQWRIPRDTFLSWWYGGDQDES